jgi:hypothetical protein
MGASTPGIKFTSMGRLPKNADNSYQYLLVRLLLGTIGVDRAGVKVRSRVDYSVLPPIAQMKTPAVAVKSFLADYESGISVEKFISVTRGDNRNFYRDLLLEFSNFQIQTHRSCHTAAFVFLYRVLERLAYATPLLYVSTQKDYFGTFNDLKALLTADVNGELGLFKKFLAQGKFIDRVKLDVTYKIKFSSEDGYQAKYYKLTSKVYNNFVSKDPVAHEFEVKFSDVSELLKNIRNRFFHARTGDGQLNIASDDMPDSDEYFGCVNQVFGSFLGVVVLQTIATKYQSAI